MNFIIDDSNLKLIVIQLTKEFQYPEPWYLITRRINLWSVGLEGAGVAHFKTPFRDSHR